MEDFPHWAKYLSDDDLRRRELEYRSGAYGNPNPSVLQELRNLMDTRKIQPYRFDDLDVHVSEVIRVTCQDILGQI